MGLVAKDIPDEMSAVATVTSNTIALEALDEGSDVLLACQLCGRCSPKEPLKELDPLEDPSRPLIDRACRGGLCCHLHRNLYFMLLFPADYLASGTCDNSGRAQCCQMGIALSLDKLIRIV